MTSLSDDVVVRTMMFVVFTDYVACSRRHCAARKYKKQKFMRVSQLSCFKHIAIGAEGLGSIAGPVKLGVASQRLHRRNVSSRCCPDAKPRKTAPLLFTRFGAIP